MEGGGSGEERSAQRRHDSGKVARQELHAHQVAVAEAHFYRDSMARASWAANREREPMSGLKFFAVVLGSNLQPATSCPLDSAQFTAGFIEGEGVLR